jgi:hypothetical protein
MASTANRVILKRDCQEGEGKAGGAITPGHLIAWNSSGDLVVHATPGGNAAKMFALENELYGQTTADAYADDDRVPFFVARPGDVVQARIKASENIAKGDYLESAGDGTLQKVTADSADLYNANVIAVALDATNTGSVVKLAVQII